MVTTGNYVDEIHRILAPYGGGKGLLKDMDIFQEPRLKTFLGRTEEFEEHRSYSFGDDSHDIDWRASARSEHVLIKKFQPEKEHQVVLAADTGKNMHALTSASQWKHEVAFHAVGISGLLCVRKRIGFQLITGNHIHTHQSVKKKGEEHLERVLTTLKQSLYEKQSNDIEKLLYYIGTTTANESIIIMVTDSPTITPSLRSALSVVCHRHQLVWIIVDDFPMLSDSEDLLDCYDINQGFTVKRQGMATKSLLREYHESEMQYARELDQLMKGYNIFYCTISQIEELTHYYRSLSKKGSRRGK